MYILEINGKSFSDMEETRKEKLLSLLRNETGFLSIKNKKGRNIKILTHLHLGEGVEQLLKVTWDSIIGTKDDWSNHTETVRTGKKILQVPYYGNNISDWWKETKGILEEKDFQGIEVLLEKNFSDLRVAEQLCSLDKRVRLTGGVLMTLPSLNLRVGKKDGKGWSRFEKGTYDDLKPLDIGLVDLDSLVRSTVVTLEKKEKQGKKKVNTGKRVGIRSTGLVEF